jgi:hypothetical protein
MQLLEAALLLLAAGGGEGEGRGGNKRGAVLIPPGRPWRREGNRHGAALSSAFGSRCCRWSCQSKAEDSSGFFRRGDGRTRSGLGFAAPYRGVSDSL